MAGTRPAYLELSSAIEPEHEQVRDLAHQMAADVLRPASIQLDKLSPAEVVATGSPLWDVVRAWYGLGQHAAVLSEEVGGAGLDPLAQSLVFEELGWGAADLAVSLGVASFPFVFAERAAMLSGSRALIDDIVAPYVADREGRFIGCWALTEPGHGSDQLGIGMESFNREGAGGGCRARRDGDEWVLSGQKSAWVSNGTIATHALLFCTIDPRLGMAGGGVAVVPLDVPGVKRGAPLDKIGQRALNQGEIFFDDARVPAEYMIAGPELYTAALDMTLATANAAMGSMFTGLARAAFEEALTYARERRQGGKVIAEHQLVQSKLFGMFSRVEQARALSRSVFVYNSITLPPVLQYSIASKVSCTRAAFETASDAIQIFGGTGLVRGMLVEKLFRDARSSLIEDGVNEFLELVGACKVIASYGT
ncbi:MAG: acyl-CoA dehydrogenase family protein [Acidimicrobiales bacterium]